MSVIQNIRTPEQEWKNLISGMHQSLDQKHKNSLIHLLGSSRRYLQFHVKVCLHTESMIFVDIHYPSHR